MITARKTIVIFMTLAILCGLCGMVFATTNAILEDTATPPTLNPFEYAKAPDGLYVFIYHGSPPYMSIDIDTSGCIVGRLYAYNSATDSVVEISAQTVSAYTYTQTALYYVTTEQKIYKTDYTGTNHEYLYQCPQGTISTLKSYWDTLYFIEDQTSVMHLDVESKTVQEIWSHEDLYWALMLNTTQLVAITVDEENYLYDIPTNTATLISSIEATNLVTAAVKGGASNNTRATTTGNFSSIVLTQENDISFPLAEYPAVPDDYFNQSSSPQYSRPISWFHVNGEEGCYTGNCKTYGGSSECEGFAMYVHDVYAHMVNYNIATVSAWESNKCITKFRAPNGSPSSLPEKVFNEDPQRIEDFFTTLNTGAYIRYGKNSDNSPDNGCHSIVFIARDSGGIWAYECNQAYDGVSSHGCGVFIQYYTYSNLTKYDYIVNYVNHSFTEAPIYDNTTYHKVGCEDCSGYVRQKHTNVSTSYIDTNNHRATFNCCGGNVVTASHNNVSERIVNFNQHQTVYLCCNESSSAESHTGSVTYTQISSSKHSVRYSCCSGYISEVHFFEYNENNQRECIDCGYVNNNRHNIGDEEII